MAAVEAGSRGGPSLELTPTWVAALVCAIIVTLSLAVEKIFHLLSKFGCVLQRLKRLNRKFLYKALQKLKEELLLMGFISLLLARLQDEIVRVCIPESWAVKGLPCNMSEITSLNSNSTVIFGTGRHLFADEMVHSYCEQKGKVPLLSYHALHDLHMLIFVLAVVHVVVCSLTVLFGAMKLSQWRKWEETIISKIQCADLGTEVNVVNVRNEEFIKNRFLETQAGKRIWLTHCRGNPNFNFYEYMMRVFEADFSKIVSISWYVWVFVVISLLLNLAGWHIYFWITFFPFILLLILGTKLEQVITLLAAEVVRKHSGVVGEMTVQPSDHYFWFHRPRIVLLLINVVLSCNSFAIAVFFWIYSRYGFQTCSLHRDIFMIPKLIIVTIVQILVSYSTLPLYTIVTQMGNSCHKEAMKNSVCGHEDGDIETGRGSESSDMPAESAQVEKIQEQELERRNC